MRLWACCLPEFLAGLACLEPSQGGEALPSCSCKWGISGFDPTLACDQLSNLIFLGFLEAINGGLVPGTDLQRPCVQAIWGTCPLLALGFQNITLPL